MTPPHAAAAAVPPSRWWVARACLFWAGMIAMLLGADRYLGRHFARGQGAGTIDPVVWRTIEQRSRRPDAGVTAVVLGDSVAAQLFYPGTERDPRVEYLTANQAIGLPGQLHLLRRAAARLPKLHDVYLLLNPRSWANDLNGPLARDYFAAFFHEPADVTGVFRDKADVELAAAQLGRMVLPNLMAANSTADVALMRESTAPHLTVSDDPRDLDANAPPPPPAAAAEPLLAWASAACRRLAHTPPYPPVRPVPPGTVPPIRVSPLSADFLGQMRQFCRDRGLALHVLPCPSSDARPFDATTSPYDAPLWYWPAADFADRIHLRKPLVPDARRQAVERYGMPPG